MIRVILKGHDNTYGISDILRLFCSNIKEDKENNTVIGESERDLVLINEVYEERPYTYVEGENRPETSKMDPIAIKRDVKRSFYIFMCELTGRTFPWGCLTGIRPTVVAAEEGCDPERLVNTYLVREDKARLACDTARTEARILEELPKGSLNIYIGVPFCPSRCEYCSFISADATKHLDLLDSYEEAIETELKIISEKLSRPISSVYIGGGTPTVFSENTFERLLDATRRFLPIRGDTEFTVEAGRPDTITIEKLRSMKDHGVGRICINPQTMKSETLRKLNRKHSAEDIIRAYVDARKVGIETINMDLIAGLKYETGSDLIDSVKALIDLDPENITIHALYKKRRAGMSREDVLDENNQRGNTDDAVIKAYEILGSHGFIPYYMYRQKDTGHGLENVGFSKPGSECRYNVAMMTDVRDVLSIGAGGMSKRIFDGGRYERCPCTKDVYQYIRNPNIMAEKKIRFFEE